MKSSLKTAKMESTLYICGRCSQCSRLHSHKVPAKIDTSGLPRNCDCGGDIVYEKLEHHHHNLSVQPKTNWPKIICLSICIFLVALGLSYLYALWRINRPDSADEMLAARHEVDSMSAGELLQEMKATGLSDRTAVRLLNTNPSTLRRLVTGITQPTVSFDASVRGLATDWRLLDHSWLLVRLRYRDGTQQFRAYRNPIQEEFGEDSLHELEGHEEIQPSNGLDQQNP